MKIFLPILLLLPLSLLSQSQTLKVMTFNIRYNNPGDGDNAWPNRMDLVDRLLQFHQPDIMGVQEALPGQMEDLQNLLPGFAYEGIARTEGGEYSALWYRTSRLEHLDGGTFYLSPTPDTLSVGWDAALPRIASWAILRDRRNGKEIFAINTHFDHMGETARHRSAELILTMIDSLNPADLPVVLTGDFNATPQEPPIQALLSGGMLDSRAVSLRKAHGPDGTWTGWQIAGEPGRRIDFVFVKGDIAVYRQASLAESFSGRFPSDHLPVMAEVECYPPTATTGLHAHNDYEHDRPLFDALTAGATSIEADVWLIDGELRVSHERPLIPDHTPTLEDLYFQPLANWAEAHGGAVYPGHQKPLQLMIDVKHQGRETLAALHEAWMPYRHLPVQVVISGDRDIAGILSDPDSLFWIDGRTADLDEMNQMQRTPMVSMRYGELFSWNGKGDIPSDELATLSAWISEVHEAGATARLWAIPDRPEAWRVLIDAGLDWLNVDDLEAGRVILLDVPEK